jgi:hypothetical protein
MVIEISSLRRPGQIMDSSKLAILGNMVAGSIKQKTKGKYVAKSQIIGRTIKIKLKKAKETGELVQTTHEEQEILAGRLSSFLNGQGVTHDISVK